jgi:hypothetical protein
MEEKHGTFISSFPNHIVAQHIFPKILHIISPKFWKNKVSFILENENNVEINKGFHFENF